MASPVTDLEAGLQAMQNLKPPGVSGSRITSLTTLCVSNIQACQLIRGRALSRPRSFTGSPVVVIASLLTFCVPSH